MPNEKMENLLNLALAATQETSATIVPNRRGRSL